MRAGSFWSYFFVTPRVNRGRPNHRKVRSSGATGAKREEGGGHAKAKKKIHEKNGKEAGPRENASAQHLCQRRRKKRTGASAQIFRENGGMILQTIPTGKNSQNVRLGSLLRGISAQGDSSETTKRLPRTGESIEKGHIITGGGRVKNMIKNHAC